MKSHLDSTSDLILEAPEAIFQHGGVILPLDPGPIKENMVRNRQSSGFRLAGLQIQWRNK